jgi:hypothetical protein
MKGKALLVLTRTDSKLVPFDLRCYVQSGNDWNGGWFADEDFQLLTTDSLPCPDAAYGLREGESVTVSVVYEFSYHQSYEGEWDVDLCYHKQRVLKRTRAPRRYVDKRSRVVRS